MSQIIRFANHANGDIKSESPSRTTKFFASRPDPIPHSTSYDSTPPFISMKCVIFPWPHATPIRRPENS